MGMHIGRERETSWQGIMEELKMKRKKGHPLLLLIQRGSYNSRKSEFLRQKSKEGNHTASPKDDSVSKYCEVKSCTSQLCSQVSPADIDCSCYESSSPTDSWKSGSWMGKVTALRELSGCISQLSPSEIDRRPSLPMSSISRYSTSYTSWTRPLAGQDNTDSLGPCSDILDDDNTEENVAPHDVSKHRRKSSADTYKDIDDIEDFEFDDLSDCDFMDEDDKVFVDDELIEEGKDKG